MVTEDVVKPSFFIGDDAAPDGDEEEVTTTRQKKKKNKDKQKLKDEEKYEEVKKSKKKVYLCHYLVCSYCMYMGVVSTMCIFWLVGNVYYS